MTVLKPDLPTPRTRLLTIEEAAPLFRKTQTAMRWWIRQDTCPLKVARIGGRLFLRESDCEAYIDAQFEASA
ncbi:helix-turn-helix domain-containing protein [Curtobacterium flaccumfaciens pv. flaccumfaciens]|uniref:helix-turn-helix domain-containing protein n=1 Tax=Curtobacterium poinsettiae TaxID=159612 RepID=UPI00217D2380|nr:helix-turn-helix domain-containing protein [Curtobacterium flaccumfaciens]MCS6565561.1 helix-turn-helix domain-containing protein [Curtobacterium flaccumfaciens pv. flaccumfaciens]